MYFIGCMFLALLLSSCSSVQTQGLSSALSARDVAGKPDENLLSGDFLMAIEDVFSISGRGTVVTGRIEQGKIRVGDEVEVVGLKATQKSVVTGIEMFRKLLDEGVVGDNVGLLLRGVDKDAVERGQVVAKPSSIKASKQLTAEVYLLTKEEGGRASPIFRNYRPRLYFRTADVLGSVELAPNVEMVRPGDNAVISITLIVSIAMKVGDRFTIREGGRTIGAGVVMTVVADKP